jgi:hypothetical protein
MVIEHSFVTTLPETPALERVSVFLQNRGFSSPQPPVLTSGNSVLEMHRGQTNPARARNVSELPQAIRLEFDRGRINVAASITPNAVWGGRSFTHTELDARRRDTADPRRLKLHTDLLMGIVLGLESLLAQQLPEETAVQQWLAAEQQITLAAQRRKRRNVIILTLLLLFIFAIVGLVAYSASR